MSFLRGLKGGLGVALLALVFAEYPAVVHAQTTSASVSGTVQDSQAGILPGKIVRPGVWWGTPVQPLDEYKRQNAHVKSLGRIRDELKELKRQIAELIKRD